VLMNYSWPGNVRQLKNAVDTMVVLCNRTRLTVESLPPDIRPSGGSITGSVANVAGMSLEQLEKEAIVKTLEMVHGNREQAAKLLGIGERTLYRKIKEYGL
jgi:DNA-binding NtrC family response regulator